MDEQFMKEAIKLALKSYKKNEVPVGAIVVKNNKIIGYGYNKTEKKKCQMYHAEINAIKMATKKIKNWRLDDCTIYVTMEPCLMCCGLINNSRIRKIVYAVDNPNFGGTKKLKNIEITTNICSKEYKELLQNFFKTKRK